ncbi:MAG: TetR family transcriptional regulator C-terminal domain-containing protein [Desulfuromonadales bacterium]|nr:TetR family transcriptional regulator C-terminal domain-containing protein [Desulfuromonadales bacterium]
MASKGEITREKLISEATRIIRQRGFVNTSVSDLVTATGVKKGSLYFHFPGKDALGLAVLERARERFLEFFSASLQGPTPGNALKNFFDAVVAYHRSHGFVGGCIFGNTALEMGDGNERFGSLVDQVFREMADRLQAVILAAQQTGQVRDDLPAADLADQVVITLEGGIMLARLRKDERPLRQALDILETLLKLPR